MWSLKRWLDEYVGMRVGGVMVVVGMDQSRQGIDGERDVLYEKQEQHGRTRNDKLSPRPFENSRQKAAGRASQSALCGRSLGVLCVCACANGNLAVSVGQLVSRSD